MAKRASGATRTKGPQGRANAVTEEALLDAAASLFRERSFSGASTREIAERLGIQKASLYYHISEKEDLLYRLCIRSMTDALDEANAIVDGDGDSQARIHEFIQAHLKRLLQRTQYYGIAMTEIRFLSGRRREECVALRTDYERVLRALLRDGQREGVIRKDISVKMLSLTLLNLLNWTMFWARPDGPMSATDIADALETVFLDGARDREG